MHAPPIKPTNTAKTASFKKSPSLAELETQLKDRIFELATQILGEPTNSSRNSDYLRFGKKGQISVGIKGKHLGVFTNFEKNVKGGPLRFIEDQLGLSSLKEALNWAIQWLESPVSQITTQKKEKLQNDKKYNWLPIVPVPNHVEDPDIVGNKYLKILLQDGDKEISRHAYRDEQGNLKGYVFRIERPNGDKFTPPLAYCENEEGLKYWRWQAFETENRSLYGLEKLAQDHTKPILVVEGEKTADAAQKLLPEYHVLTWCGGAVNVKKSNWRSLVGKPILIWPDNDEPGYQAADTIQKILTTINTEHDVDALIHIVQLPPNVPEKWDLADPLPKGLTYQKILNCLNPRGSTIHEH
jgi:hypothetical protein